MEDKIIELVVGKDEVTWQSMLLDLVRASGMNPWDIDISLLTQKYVGMLKKLKDLDFRVSGKMVLAAAILLRFKTARLVGEDMMELDRLMRPTDPDAAEEGFYDELESEGKSGPVDSNYPELLPRTPQPRTRKVSIYDLMNALEKALEVRDRRVIRRIPLVQLRMPEKKIDITKLIGTMYSKIQSLWSQSQKLTLTMLAASEKKEDKMMAFIPILHLANIDERKIDLIQREPFGEVEIVLLDGSAAVKEEHKAEPVAQ